MKFTKKALKGLKKDVFSSRLEKRVIGSLLDTGLSTEDLYAHLTDVTTYGCASGIVTELIYYHETSRFFDCYRAEILELAQELDFLEDGHSSHFSTEEKNELAWLGYDTVCIHILDYFENR